MGREMRALTDLSKVLSHALRHEPWLYELELDDEGWVPIDAVLVALRSERESFHDVTKEDLERVIAVSAKARHEIAPSGDRIRALYGHSLPGKLHRTRAAPPAVLFHGTSPEAARSIAADGVRPMSRQYVHLSVDTAMAIEVALRKTRTPVLFAIEARAAHDAGIAFYEGNDKVWLADLVPATFMNVVQR